MGIRKPNRKTSNRRDGSTVPVPTAAPATITPIAGGVNINVPGGLIANQPDGVNEECTGIILNNSAGSFSTGLQVEQTDQFNATVTHTDLLPGTFSGTLELSPAMTGIRSARGGTLVIPSIVFP